MAQTKAQLVVGLNVNASAPASALQIDASGNVNLDSNTLYVDATNNRVGVGTATPTATLDCNGSIRAISASPVIPSSGAGLEIYYASGTFNGTPSAYLLSYDRTGTVYKPINIDASEQVFRTSGSEKMRLTSTGLGIGTSSPAYRLSISEASGTQSALGLTSGASTLIIGSQDVGSGRSAISYSNNSGLSNNILSLGFGAVTSGVPANPVINLTQAGNVGIGTTSPGATLDVNGAINAASGATTITTLNYSGTAVPNGANNSALYAADYNIGLGGQYASLNFVTTNGAPTTTAWWMLGRSDGTNDQFSLRVRRGQTSGSDQMAYSVVTTGADSAKIIDSHRWFTNGSERARIDSSGRLLVGTSSASLGAAVIYKAGSGLQVTEPQLTVQNSIADGSAADGPGINFANASGPVASIGSGGNGGIYIANRSSTAGSWTERVRINNNGLTKISNSGSYHDASDFTHEITSDRTGNSTLHCTARNTGFTAAVGVFGCLRGANSVYTLMAGYSGNGSSPFADLEFSLRGDGNGLCDGAWTGGGADYAEYFEWSDSNSDKEDRRGISVVLDGDKIREAVAGEDPVGVISGNPSVVGDAAWNKWSGKYLRDEFGTYLLDENGDRQLNPAYDPDQEYISREQRPEWDCVGLMGKLRIRKGQVTGSRWIKMRDISDSVEEWLVR